MNSNTLLVRLVRTSYFTKDKSIEEILEFYMGKNTPDRQGFIIDNLKVEEDYFEEEKELT